ncbi:MAG TPA: hypothetical protein P5569_14425 [Candidatus Latescibacteria bacterium]|nr:hypothetical protein [Candidatus Latescibacterota bacterium]
MAIFDWALAKARTFTVWDWGALKICLFSAGLLVAKLWPGVLGLDWYWYALIFAITYVWVMVRMFAKSA